MTDKEVIEEIEANEQRAAEGERERNDDGPGNVITDAIGSILRPLNDADRPDEDEAAARRAENDAEQRPE